MRGTRCARRAGRGGEQLPQTPCFCSSGLPTRPQQSTLLLLQKKGSEASCLGSRAVSRMIAKNMMGKRKDKGEVEWSRGDGRAGTRPCMIGPGMGDRGQPQPGRGCHSPQWPIGGVKSTGPSSG